MKKKTHFKSLFTIILTLCLVFPSPVFAESAVLNGDAQNAQEVYQNRPDDYYDYVVLDEISPDGKTGAELTVSAKVPDEYEGSIEVVLGGGNTGYIPFYLQKSNHYTYTGTVPVNLDLDIYKIDTTITGYDIIPESDPVFIQKGKKKAGWTVTVKENKQITEKTEGSYFTAKPEIKDGKSVYTARPEENTQDRVLNEEKKVSVTGTPAAIRQETDAAGIPDKKTEDPEKSHMSSIQVFYIVSFTVLILTAAASAILLIHLKNKIDNEN